MSDNERLEFSNAYVEGNIIYFKEKFKDDLLNHRNVELKDSYVYPDDIKEISLGRTGDDKPGVYLYIHNAGNSTLPSLQLKVKDKERYPLLDTHVPIKIFTEDNE